MLCVVTDESTEVVLRSIAGWGIGPHLPPVEPIDIEAMGPALSSQKLIGVLQAMVETGACEVDDSAALEVAHLDAMAESLLLEDMLLQAAAVLDEAGIAWRVLKGSALAHLVHPDPAQRTFGDIDLLVRGEEIIEAVDALTRAGATRAQPALSETFDRRFSKSVTMRWRNRTELDVHRTLAPGPFGLRVDTEDLFVDPRTFTLAGRPLLTLNPEMHLLHGAIHVALGDVLPRLGNVRDLALLLNVPDLDGDHVREVARSWGCELPLALGLRAAGDIGADGHPLVTWARGFSAPAADLQLLAVYRHKANRFRAQAWATLRVLPWRDKPIYARSLLRRGND